MHHGARLAILLVIATAAAAAAGTIETVALTGEAAPAGDVYVAFLFEPALGEGGEVLFGGLTTTTSGFVHRGIPGAVVELARVGDAAPDGNGSFSSVSPVGISSTGGALFSAFLSGTAGGSGDDTGIFFHPAGAGATVGVVREGQADPEGNGVFGTPTFAAQIVDGDLVAFRSLLTGTSGGSNDNVGFYFWDAGTITRMVRDGQSLPGGLTARDPRSFDIDDDGNATFMISLSVAPDSAVFNEVGGALSLLAREGDLVDDPVRLGDFRLRTPDRNEAGDVAFWVELAGTGSTANNQGVFLHSGGALTELLRKGDATPDGLDTFTQFDDVLLWDDAVLTYAHLATAEVGLYRLAPSETTVELLETGDASPDGDGTITNLVTGYTAVTQSGAFAAQVTIGASAAPGSDGAAIVLGDVSGHDIIVRRGTPLEGSTVDSVSFEGWTVASRTGLNGRGQVAFEATLVDGRQGVFLYTPALHWIAGSGAWGIPGNWSPSVVPGPPHPVFIDAIGPLTVSGPAAPAAVASLLVGSSAGGRADLLLTAGGSLTVAGALTVTATGGILGVDPVSGDVANEGLVAPGTSPGILAIDGDFDQTTPGRLEIDIEGPAVGTGYDRLQVTGTASLGGTLAVTFGGGFVPQPGDAFDVLTADTIVGTFDATELPALGVGLSLVVTYETGAGLDAVRLTVDGGEPAGAGAVPDGYTVPGSPLTVGKVQGGDVELSWSASCAAADHDYAVYQGLLGDWSGQTPVTCSTASATSASFTPAAGDRYFLVVPRTTGSEGSYGFRGDGAERPPSPSACVTQVLATCD